MRRDGPEALAGFEGAWRVALEVADAATRGGGEVDDERYAALAAHWDEGQIVEIMQVIGLFNYFNRFNNALRVEITR